MPVKIESINGVNMVDWSHATDTTTVPIILKSGRSEADYSTEELKKTAIKADSDKVRLELISAFAELELGKVLTFGAKKYAANNWRKGLSWSRVMGAIKRHLNAFEQGEDLDPETQLSHLAHAMCEVMFLLEFTKTHKELDDRYKDVK
jgi:hypothetical protein